jgi:hypothetical protein
MPGQLRSSSDNIKSLNQLGMMSALGAGVASLWHVNCNQP